MTNGHQNGSHNGRPKSVFERIGCEVSSWVSDVAAKPLAQIGVIIFCALWWIVGLPTDILTAGLSILAITLTQMVLNRQGEREADAHRRDVAMHAKLDELVLASKKARNEMAGIEDLDEEEIAELKEEAKDAIDQVGKAAGADQERAAAKRAIDAIGRPDDARTRKSTPKRRAGVKS